VSDQARTLAHAVMAPPVARLVPPAAWLNRVVTTGLLPPDIRRQYGFPWQPRHEHAFRALVPQIRLLRRALPDRLALWPEARETPPPSGR
jgi:uncharacterized protein (DUF2236 family)